MQLTAGMGGKPRLTTTAGAPVVIPDVFVTFEGEALVVPAPGPLANDFDLDDLTRLHSHQLRRFGGSGGGS